MNRSLTEGGGGGREAHVYGGGGNHLPPRIIHRNNNDNNSNYNKWEHSSMKTGSARHATPYNQTRHDTTQHHTTQHNTQQLREKERARESESEFISRQETNETTTTSETAQTWSLCASVNTHNGQNNTTVDMGGYYSSRVKVLTGTGMAPTPPLLLAAVAVAGAVSPTLVRRALMAALLLAVACVAVA